ncbi:MAG TPA: PfkB family carbohydrate kinase [Fibrobacteria bacterium]|nr:PfkB family carbohydrate kinase [Fibrobacteria bacterium]
MAHILVAGLNPAWQKILEFANLDIGEVNRAETLIQLASGKGLNAAKVLRRLGHEVTLLQVVGGANGQKCLEACQALGIRSVHFRVEEETRQCLTLVDRGRGTVTEIIEPFATGMDGIGESLLAALPAHPDAFDAVLLCGTLPPGVPEDIYSWLLDRYRSSLRLMDAWKGVDEALTRLAEADAGMGYLKINRKEYASLEAALSRLPAPGPLVLVTDGSADATLIRRGRVLGRIPVSRLIGVRNPIGAGDAVTAGSAHYLLQGMEPAEAFRHGLAMGSASCLTLEPAQFAWEDYESLLAGTGAVGTET